MKKIFLSLVAMGMVGFWGCSSSTKFLNDPDSLKITKDDYSTVYMFRESRVYGSVMAEPIQVNGLQLFRIGSGDCVNFKIPTGQSEIIYVPLWKRVEFVSEKGKKYYFYLSVDPGKAGSDFRQLTEDDWKEKQKACNWVELKWRK